MNPEYDEIFIGSGLGSLALASLLAKDGKKVLILEKAKEYGGCAASYTRSGYRYEAGATTLVGWEEGLPLNRLFRLLEITDPVVTALPGGESLLDYDGFQVVRLNPAMKIFLKDRSLIRSEDREEWIRECGNNFGEGRAQSRFWNLVFFLSDSVWDTSRRMSHFPPVRLKDYWHCLLNFRLRDVLLLLGSFLSLGHILRLPGFPKSLEFKKFLDEQLLITVQTTHERSPLSMGAAGISYAHLINTYVVGGIGELANFLVRKIREFGGEVLPLEEVNAIQLPGSPGEMFSVRTRKNHIYNSVRLYSGIPIWNLPDLIIKNKENISSSPYAKVKLKNKSLEDEILARVRRFSDGIWGAFNMSIAMPEFRDPSDPIHYQFHLDEKLPHGGGDSIFISCSHPSDSSRTGLELHSDLKEKILLLAVSTHIQDPETWDRKSPRYQSMKSDIVNAILDHLEKGWVGFRKDSIRNIQSASPSTWEVWTGRHSGRVGGLPGSFFRNPFRFPTSRTSFPNFYLLGDTVYPGQGIPAVVLGGLNLYSQLNLD